MYVNLKVFVILAVLVMVQCQTEPSLPLSSDSFRQVFRSFVLVPNGRLRNLNDTRIIFYKNSEKNYSAYHLENITLLLRNPALNLNKPTVLYIHGYVEIFSDSSVSRVMGAYIQRADHNTLALDWANFAFGSYLSLLPNVGPVGEVTAKALLKLVQNGLSVTGLHIVGHSVGVHVAAVIARVLKDNGYIVPRLTGLDPAYPGFYPPLYTAPISPKDATFVDIIHTDSGKFGTPISSGHADFWPNDGSAKQPGCLPFTILVTVEDLCSHWRSWEYWAESVADGNFIARQCANYEDFLRGNCSGTARMGLLASPELRGNFYLRTASNPPFALAERGAV